MAGCVSSREKAKNLKKLWAFAASKPPLSLCMQHRPVHVLLPSPVSWVLEVCHTSGETVPEKRSPGTASPRLGNAVHMKPK